MMSTLGYLLLTVARILQLLINIYTFVVAAAVIISWVNPDPYNPIVRLLYQLTAPVFRQVRRFIPRSWYQTGFDFAPIVVFVLLIALDTIVVNLLFDLARTLVGH